MKRVAGLLAAVTVLAGVWATSTSWLPGASAQRAAASCCTVPGADFPKVGGNYGNQNTSALARINRANISTLGGAWHLNLEGGPSATPAAPTVGDEPPAGRGRAGRGGVPGGAPGGPGGGGGGGGAGGQQSTVVAIGGVLYVETSQGNVHALDGKTGQTKWVYKSGFGTQLRRGVAVGAGRVFTAAAGKRVIALDQNTGAVVWIKQLGDDDGSRGSLKTAIVYFDGLIYFGTADASRGTAYALNAETGAEAWHFFGPAGLGEFGAETWEGDTYKTGGASPWMHPAIDPELGLAYFTFGNARAGGATDGSTRGGLNLFANSIVAVNAKTGKRVWHFQSVHHDIWDMDNVMAPVLADVPVAGRVRKIVIYGSKTGMLYILDRADGSAITPIDEKPMPQLPSQKTWPTQPIPRGDSLISICPNSDPTNRVPPNYKSGCLFTPHADEPVVQSPGTGGGIAWSAMSFDPATRLIYTGVGIVNSGHVQSDGGVGFRPLGEERSGKIIAFNPATHKIAWQRPTAWSLAHGNGMLTTAGGVMFIGQPDGILLGLDMKDGKELWRWQTGAGVHTSPITYEIDGEQYLAVFAGGNGLPYNSPRGDDLWALKVGGTVDPAATPVPPPVRQPITAAPVEGSVAKNTVAIARNWANGVVAPGEAVSQNSMAPQHLRVPVGTTVTFINPADNTQPHCVTQFYEKLFASPKLAPGQSYTYTFTKPGEYFYNDCTSPRTTGKVFVYAPTPATGRGGKQ